MVIDGALLCAAFLSIILLSTRRVDNIASAANTALLLLALTIFYWGIFNNIVYDAFLVSRFGATLGKALLGLRVEDENSQNLTYWMSVFRHTVGYTVASLLWGTGFFWIFKDVKRQGWHDKMVGSFVVVGKQGRPACRIGRGVLGFLALTSLLTVNCTLGFSIAKSIFRNESLKKDLITLVENYRNSEKAILKEEGTGGNLK